MSENIIDTEAEKGRGEGGPQDPRPIVSGALVRISTGELVGLGNADWILTTRGDICKVVAINLHSVKTFDRPRKNYPGPPHYGHAEFNQIVAVYKTHAEAVAATTPPADDGQDSLF